MYDDRASIVEWPAAQRSRKPLSVERGNEQFALLSSALDAALKLESQVCRYAFFDCTSVGLHSLIAWQRLIL